MLLKYLISNLDKLWTRSRLFLLDLLPKILVKENIKNGTTIMFHYVPKIYYHIVCYSTKDLDDFEPYIDQNYGTISSLLTSTVHETGSLVHVTAGL